jgi:hypothetical protein
VVRITAVGATLRMLRHYQAFLRSEYAEMRSPEGHWGVHYAKPEAARRLEFLIHVAVNRRAGLDDVRGRKWDDDYQRTMRLDADRINRAGTQRLIVRVTEITTPGWRQRFAHRLEGSDEWLRGSGASHAQARGRARIGALVDRAAAQPGSRERGR